MKNSIIIKQFFNKIITFLSGKQEIVLLCILLASALFLLLFNNSHEDFWYKELLPIHYAGLNSFSLLKELAVNNPEAAPPLYYLLMKGVIAVFGTSAFVLRACNAFWICILLLTVYLCTRHLFDRQTAFAACCFLLFNPITIANGRELNALPLAAVLIAAALFAFYLALSTGRTRYWVYYGVLQVLGIYTHYFAWFVFLGSAVYFAVYLIWFKPKQTPLRPLLLRCLIVNGAVGLLFLPWLLPFLKHWQALQNDPWFEPVNFLVLRNILTYFYTSKFGLELNPLLPGFVTAIFVLLMIFFMLYPELRHKVAADKYLFLLIPVLLPLLVTLLFSIFFFSIINLRNYYLFFPFYAILAGRAYALVKHKYFKILLPVLLCFSLVPALYFSYTEKLNGPASELSAYLVRERSADEPILVCDKISLLTLKHYLGNDVPLYFYTTTGEASALEHGLAPQQWYELNRGLQSFWIVLAPWGQPDFIYRVVPDFFSKDPVQPERVIEGNKSWIKFKILHFIRTI